MFCLTFTQQQSEHYTIHCSQQQSEHYTIHCSHSTSLNLQQCEFLQAGLSLVESEDSNLTFD